MSQITCNGALRIVAILVALAWLPAARTAAASPADLTQLFAQLNELNTPGYTGGLPSRNRALAERIRAAMLPQFPKIDCAEPPWNRGTLVAYSDDKTAAISEPSLEGIDPNLAQLLKAFHGQRQEVRDTATYAIGLLGPSARDAIPFVEKKFAEGSFGKGKEKGNWANDAFAKLTCQRVVPADFRQVIPDTLLPPQEPWREFLRKAAVLLPTLYLDQDVEYPPGLMSHAFSNYAMAEESDEAGPLLARILLNDKLSLQKRVEAIEVLRVVPPRIARASIDGVLKFIGTNDPELKFQITEILLRLGHEAAIPLLIERIPTEWHYAWDGLCKFGVAARQAEPALLTVVTGRRWPTDIRAAIEVLGCIKSRKAVSLILPMLEFPDWDTQQTIATALGKIGDRRLIVLHTLTELARHHWSKIVRTAAANALVDLNNPLPEWSRREEADPVELVVIGGAPPIDHGLPWCDRGKVSFDGANWFDVNWHEPQREELPADFPAFDFTGWVKWNRVFLRVEDGWLYGNDIGEFGGGLYHISDLGEITELEPRDHTNIMGIVHKGRHAYAFGYQVMLNGYGGVLFEVSRQADGAWQSKRVANLPSPVTRYAVSPTGEMVLSDGVTVFSFIDNRIVPLKCQKVHSGNYFEELRLPKPASVSH